MLFRKMCEIALKEFQEGMCVVCFRRETSDTAVQQNIGRIWSAVYTTLAWGYWWWSHTQVGLCMPCLTITSSYLGLLAMITHPGRSLHALPVLHPLICLWTSRFKTSVQMVEEVKIRIPNWLYFEIRNRDFWVMNSGTKNIMRCLRLCVAHHSLFAVEHETCLLTSPEKKCERGLW